MSDPERIYGEERRYDIVQTARALGRVEVVALAERFNVSAETIRQDLNALQASGVIRRVHGGAVPIERTLYEPQIDQRTEFAEEKRAIAEAALQFLPDSGALFLESGSTSMLVAQSLPLGRDYVVFTNSLPIATLLAQRTELTVMTLGGRVRPVTLGEVDSIAIRSLQEINVDVAFLGTNGVSARHGLTTPDRAEADFKQETLRAARTTVVLTDRSKIGNVALWRYGATEDVDHLVTSAGADAEELKALEASGLALTLV
jgi:DeoR family fructose operon transcriptional repressor